MCLHCPLAGNTRKPALVCRISYKVDIVIVCGSGLAPLADAIQNPVQVEYKDIPFFPESSVKGEVAKAMLPCIHLFESINFAAGHSSTLVFGDLHGHKVVAMKGRFHYYEVNRRRNFSFTVSLIRPWRRVTSPRRSEWASACLQHLVRRLWWSLMQPVALTKVSSLAVHYYTCAVMVSTPLQRLN
jgi:hypothetical protein